MAEIIGMLSAIIAVAETSLQIVRQIEKVRRRLLFSFKQIPEAKDKITLISDSLKSVKSERALQTASVNQRVKQIQDVIQELYEFLEQLKNHSKGIRERLTNVLTGPKKEKRLSQLLDRLDVLIPYLHFDITVAQSGKYTKEQEKEPEEQEQEQEQGQEQQQEAKMNHQSPTTNTTINTTATAPAPAAKANEGRRVARAPTRAGGQGRPHEGGVEDDKQFKITPRQSIDSDTTFDNECSSPVSEASVTVVEEPIDAVKDIKPCNAPAGSLLFVNNKGGKDNVMFTGNMGNVNPFARAPNAVLERNVFGDCNWVIHGNMGAEAARNIFVRRWQA